MPKLPTTLEAAQRRIVELMELLDDARARIPEDDAWCEHCERYCDDYRCGCVRCEECGELTGRYYADFLGLDIDPLCDRCAAYEEQAEAKAVEAHITQDLRAHQHRRRPKRKKD